MARPSNYSKELASEICARMAEGKSLRTICKSDDMPATSTVFLWLKADNGFSEQYEAAAQERAHALAEEALEIADDAALAPENVQAARLRVDTRKWFASKLAPKRYGDKVSLGSETETGGPLIISWTGSPTIGSGD